MIVQSWKNMQLGNYCFIIKGDKTNIKMAKEYVEKPFEEISKYFKITNKEWIIKNNEIEFGGQSSVAIKVDALLKSNIESYSWYAGECIDYWMEMNFKFEIGWGC